MTRIFLTVSILTMFLGVLYASREPKHTVDPKTCIGCALCVQTCPTKAIAMKEGKAVIDPDKCVNCSLCAQKCPVKAIHGPSAKPSSAEKKTK